MKVGLSLGHWGKLSKPKDRGAIGEVVEAHETLRYMTELAIALERANHQVWLFTFGNYKQRQIWANELDLDLFMACHLNSATTPGNYGLILYDERGRKGKIVAEAIAEEAQRLLGYEFKVWGLGPQGRGFNNIKWTKMTALILEPAFVSGITWEKFNSKLFAEAVIKTIGDYNGLKTAH